MYKHPRVYVGHSHLQSFATPPSWVAIWRLAEGAPQKAGVDCGWTEICENVLRISWFYLELIDCADIIYEADIISRWWSSMVLSYHSDVMPCCWYDIKQYHTHIMPNWYPTIPSLIAWFMGPALGPSGADRTQVPCWPNELCYLGYICHVTQICNTDMMSYTVIIW